MMPIPFFQAPPQPAPQQPQPTYTPQPYAQQPYAQQPYAPPSAGWQAAPQSPVLAAQAAQINQPKARGYAPEPKPAPPVQPVALPAVPKSIQLPTPEELGFKSAPPTVPAIAGGAAPGLPSSAQATVDWNQTHTRLRELGAVGFHVDHLPGNVTRVRMMMPTGQPGQSRLVEALASSDAEAIATMFERATSR